ncbi:MAG: hypothetical protein ACD_63C00081G0010 [uncultured bacterium]|nr:MAG: hypothetical protein ACD_63C00081G0010 [uncultured bacterium]
MNNKPPKNLPLGDDKGSKYDEKPDFQERPELPKPPEPPRPVPPQSPIRPEPPKPSEASQKQGFQKFGGAGGQKMPQTSASEKPSEIPSYKIPKNFEKRVSYSGKPKQILKKSNNQFAQRKFDRGDKPIAQQNQKTFGFRQKYKPKDKKMVQSGVGRASAFQRSESLKTKTGQGKLPQKPKTSETGPLKQIRKPKVIVPPKSFRARTFPMGALVAIVIIAVIAATGLVAYFGFRKQTVKLYDRTIAIFTGKETPKPAPTPVPTITPTPTKVATLENVTFTESTDPVSGSKVEPQDVIIYTLTLKNMGGTDLANLSITNPLPDGTENLTILSTPTGAADNSSEKSVDISGINLATGESQAIKFQTTVKADVSKETIISNKATLAQNGSKKISNNNTPSTLNVIGAETPAAGLVELEKSKVIENKTTGKSGTDVEASPKDEIAYTLTVKNNSDKDITETVIDDLSEVEDFASVTNPIATDSTGTSFDVSYNQTKIESEITLGPSEEAEITFDATILDGSKWKDTDKEATNTFGNKVTLTLIDTTPKPTTTAMPIPTATPAPTATTTPTPTPTSTAIPIPTPTPTSTTTAPEETEDETTNKEEASEVETGGESLYIILAIYATIVVAGLGLVKYRKKLLG